ncbi:MAG: galactokinase [bacterium]|nr:galactokinase [bacterium]
MDARSRVLEGFRLRFGGEPEWLVRAPGRANILGAHIDYSEGWVLPGALDRSVWLACRAAAGGERKTSVIRALDIDAGAESGADAELDAEWLPVPVAERDIEHQGGSSSWLDLPRGVAWALARAGHQVPPIEAAFASDLPIGAGVSSSAAVEVAFLMAWEAAAGITIGGVERARVGRRVENDYLGVRSGIMDQFTSIHGRSGHLILLDCRDLSFEQVPLPGEVAIVVADTGVRRTLVDSDYNSRPDECRRAVERLREFLPGIRTLRDVTLADLEQHGAALSSTLRKRARHAVGECRRVLDGAEALRSGNLLRFGELMRESHQSSRDLYEVSIPELDALAHAAWSSPGCYGARLSGAGFGGCVIALVEADAAGEVERRLWRDFERAFGRSCATFVSGFGEGAALEPIDPGD